MKTKFTTFLFLALVTTTPMGLPLTAQAQTPQSCYDGYEYIGSKKYKKAVNKLTMCLRSGSLTNANRAKSYYNRAEAYTFLYDEKFYGKNPDYKKANNYLDKAFEDIEKSIELDPTGNAMAYCLRGYVWLEESWGMVGDEDIDKALAMGASKDSCDYW